MSGGRALRLPARGFTLTCCASPWSHASQHRALHLRARLTRGLGLAYMAFLETEEFDLIIDILKRSDDPENALSHHPRELGRIVEQVRNAGYATRSSLVEPRNSNTIAVPIISENGRVLASLGLTYFKSAFASEQEACSRYVPILKTAVAAISEDLSRLSASIAVDVNTNALD